MTAGPTLRELRQAARARLSGPDAALEVDLLLTRVLDKPRTFLITWPDHQPTPEQRALFEADLERLAGGEPLAYILGERAFWRLTLAVTPDVLVPRPDTECVVEKVLALGAGQVWRVADLGTGSGAIALSLALEHPDWQVVATDIHADSLAVARANAVTHGLTNVEFVHGSWFEPLTGRFHCLVSNPPYIADSDPHLANLRHEPRRALVAADDGLADLRHIVRLSGDFLHAQGWIVLEHGFEQGADVRRLLSEAGFGQVASGRDYGGNERYTVGQKC